MPDFSRRQLLTIAAASTAALALPRGASAANKELVLAEAAHIFAYVPVYLAIEQGLFSKYGLDVKTLLATNGGHVAALISGQVWGNLGGPESDAMTNNGKADPLIAIVNFINRALVYYVAKKGTKPASMSPADLKRSSRARNWRSAATAARPTCSRANIFRIAAST